MKIQHLATVVTASILITACGGTGGGGTTTIPNGNGGSTTVTQGGGGNGKATIVKDLVSTSKCRSTVIKGDDSDTTFTEYAGSSGSVETPCNSSNYRLKAGVTNLNLNQMLVENFMHCKDASGKVSSSWVISEDLGKGTSTTSWTSDGKGEYIRCTGTFASPLPKTVSSSSDIDDLIDYWDDNNFEHNNCTVGTGQGQVDNTSACDSGWTFGENITFIDDKGRVHKTTRKTTWLTKKH